MESNLFDVHDRPKQGYVVAKENGFTLALDTTLTPELIREGFVRELIRQIQVMRKDAGFAVEQRIIAEITSDENADAIKEYADRIMTDILATELTSVTDPAIDRTVEISGSNVNIKLKLA